MMDLRCLLVALFVVAATASDILSQPKEQCGGAVAMDSVDELSLLSLLRKNILNTKAVDHPSQDDVAHEAQSPPIVVDTRDSMLEEFTQSGRALRYHMNDTDSLFPDDIKQMILSSALDQQDRIPPNSEKEDFPPMLGQRAFLASGPQSDRLLWTSIHPWDVAVYLDVHSPLWGKTNSFEDVIAELSSHATLFLRQFMEVPPLMPMKLLKAEMRRRVRESVEDEVAERLVDMMTSGRSSSMPKGTVTLYELDESGMSVSINGERRGRIDHSKLNREAARMYASPISSVRGLGQAIVERLKEGPPTSLIPSTTRLTW